MKNVIVFFRVSGVERQLIQCMPKGLPEDGKVVIFPGEILSDPCDNPQQSP